MAEYAAACCCTEPDDDGPDGPIIDSGCCDDHNQVIRFRVERSSRHNFNRSFSARFTEETSGYELMSLSGTIEWNLSTNIITHDLEFERSFVQQCLFSCTDGPCGGGYSSCPCSLTRQADGAQRWPALVSVDLITPPGFIDFICGVPADPTACYLRVSVDGGNPPIGPYGVFTISTDCDGFQGDEQGQTGPFGQAPRLDFRAYFKIDRDQTGFCTLGDLDLFVNTVLSIFDDPSSGLYPWDNDPNDLICNQPNGVLSRQWFESGTDQLGCPTAYGGVDQLTISGSVTGEW